VEVQEEGINSLFFLLFSLIPRLINTQLILFGINLVFSPEGSKTPVPHTKHKFMEKSSSWEPEEILGYNIKTLNVH